MSTQNLMQYLMIAILLLCGYLFLFQLVARRTENPAAVPFVSVILLIIYLAISVPLLLVIRQLGSMDRMLMALLMLFSCLFLLASLYTLLRHWRELNKGMLALFLVYLFAIAYVTIFSRDGKNDTSVYLFRLNAIEKAIRTRSLEPMYDIMLNVVLFVPMGFLMPFPLPERLNHWSTALMCGLMFTTIIESTQMLLRLGQSDLTDIVTNTLGALVGFLIYRIFMRFRGLGKSAEE